MNLLSSSSYKSLVNYSEQMIFTPTTKLTCLKTRRGFDDPGVEEVFGLVWRGEFPALLIVDPGARVLGLKVWADWFEGVGRSGRSGSLIHKGQ